MAESPTDPKLLAVWRKQLLGVGSDREKIFWWEAFLRKSIHPFYRLISGVVWSMGHREFDWRTLRDEAFMETATPQELQAYRRGAVMLSLRIREALCASLGMDFEDVIEAVNGRDKIEERVRRIVDGEGAVDPSGDAGAEADKGWRR